MLEGIIYKYTLSRYGVTGKQKQVDEVVDT